MTRRIGVGCLVIVILVVGALPLLAPHDPMTSDLEHSFEAPSGEHLLGTDGVGRDVLARLAAGALNSLGVALVALTLSSLLGAVVGGIAGYTGGVTDRAITSIVDLLLAFPRFVILLNLTAVLALESSLALGVLIGVTSWMGTARLVRTEMLSLRTREFVEAARVSGCGGIRILSRHLAPHLIQLVTEKTGLRFATVILLAASLDYLGIGLPDDYPTWGRMIRDGKAYLQDAPWIALAPIVILCLTTVGLVLMAERKARESLRT